MSTLSQYIGDTDIIARFRVRQLRVAVLVTILVAGHCCYVVVKHGIYQTVWLTIRNNLNACDFVSKNTNGSGVIVLTDRQTNKHTSGHY